MLLFVSDDNKDLWPNKFDVAIEDGDTLLTNVQPESDEVSTWFLLAHLSESSGFAVVITLCPSSIVNN